MVRAAVRLVVLLGLFLAFVASPALAVEQVTPWIGVAIGPGTHGVLVKQVIGGSPGEHAGLRPGDEILSLDGDVLAQASELIAHVQKKGVGEKVTLAVLRDGATLQVTLALVPRPDMLDLVREHLMNHPAPQFALTDAQGPHPASTSALAGHVVVVEFFATWCGPCTASIPTLDAWQAKYGPRGLRVVGISDEPMALLAHHAAAHKIEYTIAHDPGTVASAYLVPAVPTLVVIDADGKVRDVEVGAGDNLDTIEATFRPLLK